MPSLTDPFLHLPGTGRVHVSEVTAGAETRAQWLAAHCGNTGGVLCLCRPDGVPMGVGHRRLPTDIYYLYPLHRLDQLRHALGCPHRSALTQERGRVGATPRPLVEIYGGYVNVELASSLSKIHRMTDAPARAVQLATADSAPAPPSPSASLSLLAEVLWSQAALNHWTPGFRGRRSYNVMRRRLLEAARSIAVRRRALLRKLYIPPAFRETNRAEINAELAQWLSILQRRGNRQPYGFVAGLLRAVHADEEDGHFLRLAHFPRDIYLDRANFGRLEGWLRQASTFDDEGVSFVLAVVRVDERSGHLIAIESAALSLTREYLPVESVGEAILLEMLVETHRRFRRPLRAEYVHAPPTTPIPSAILEDRDDRTCLEIFPDMGSAANAQRLRQRRGAYSGERQAVWWWDPHTMIEPPEIPAPTASLRDPLRASGG